jgi:hypothetical protein
MKWLLRRFDHSSIYLRIAATYTSFMAQSKHGPFASTMLTLVWVIAAVGIVIKLALPGRFDRLSILLYLLLSWSGVMMYDMIAALPSSTLWLLGAGGLLYTFGVIFHLWPHLRFQNAVWHTFVVVAAACHYAAVLDYLARAQAFATTGSWIFHEPPRIPVKVALRWTGASMLLQPTAHRRVAIDGHSQCSPACCSRNFFRLGRGDGTVPSVKSFSGQIPGVQQCRHGGRPCCRTGQHDPSPECQCLRRLAPRR